MPVSKRVSIEHPCQRSQNRVSPVGNRGVMEMCRPEYNRGNQQAVDARGPSANAAAQKVLQDSPEKQFLRDGNREVDAKELER